MKVVHSIYIDVSPDAVWLVTVDIDRWPEWTPTVTSVRREDAGELRLGSTVLMKQPLQPESRWVVTELARGRRFVWETRRPGLHMIGSHEMRAEGSGTRNLLRVDAQGPAAILLWPVLRLAMARALVAENQGLKWWCERGGGRPRVPSQRGLRA